MKIDNVDVSQYNVVQSSVIVDSSEFQNTYFWEEAALSPFFIKKKPRIKKIQLQFAVKGSDRDVIELNASKVLGMMSKPAVYQFDKREHKFYCIADTPGIVTNCKRFKTYSTMLYGYEYSEEQKYEFLDDVTITNIATAESPAVLQITTNIALNRIIISGLTEDDIIINNVERDSPLLIDGENGVIMQGGENKYNDCDMWEFPTVKPGQNTIKLSSECAAILTYKPRYI